MPPRAGKTLVLGLGPWLDQEEFLRGSHFTYRSPRAFFREGVLRSFSPNLSCIAVASCLDDLGYDARYLDLPLELGIAFSEPRRREWLARLRRLLAAQRYDNVFVSCVSAAEHLTLASVATVLRESWPEARIGVGSYHANTVRGALLEQIPELDFVFLGDLEPLADELMERLARGSLRGMTNLLWREGEAIGEGPRRNLARRAESRFRYRVCRRYLRYYDCLAALGSKGCPFTCAFCQEVTVRRGYYVRSPADVVDETLENYALFEAECGHREVLYGWMEPMFGLNPEWRRELCAELEGRRERFPWAFQTRVGSFGAGEIARFAGVGCSLVYLGLESFSPRMLRRMHKTKRPAEYLRAFDADLAAAAAARVRIEANVLFGHPGETRATLAETRAGIEGMLARHPETSINLNLYRPLPDTESLVPAEDDGARVLVPEWWTRGVLPGATLLVQPSAELLPAELLAFYEDMYRDGRCYGRRGLGPDIERFFEDGEILPRDLEAVGRTLRERVTKGLRNPAAFPAPGQVRTHLLDASERS